MVIKKKTKKVLGFVTTSFILLVIVAAATSVALMSILSHVSKGRTIPHDASITPAVDAKSLIDYVADYE
jgi:hypothetical protein